MPRLLVVPDRLPSEEPWYPTAGEDPRKRAVQVLREAIGEEVDDAAVIGVMAVDRASLAAQRVAADLGASLAASGRKVLLVDADLGNPSDLPELQGSPSTLSKVVQRRGQEDRLPNKVLGDLKEVLPNLKVMPAGSPSGDPVDLLAGQGLGLLVEEVKKEFGIVIVALPADDPLAAKLVARRLDGLLLVRVARQLPDAERIRLLMRTRTEPTLGIVTVIPEPRRRPEGRELLRKARTLFRRLRAAAVRSQTRWNLPHGGVRNPLNRPPEGQDPGKEA